MEVVIVSSPTDAGVGCWDLETGAERLRYKSCASPAHGLASVAGRFFASSQIRERKSSSSGSVFYWSWNKPQVEVKSFPSEPICPLVSNAQGTYIVGGGVSGVIYLWEVSTGKLLKKWHAHYRAVSCLVFNEDQSLLISGAEDGYVRVWSLFLLLNETAMSEKPKQLYEHSFHEHTLKVTDVKSCCSGSNSIVVSASEDRTCKVWNLSRGQILRDIVFPSVVNAISLDSWKGVFYAGAADGKIYICALNARPSTTNNHQQDIIGAFSEQRKAVACLASSADGSLLVSGSEDGAIIVWDTRTRSIHRVLKHTKGPINNVVVMTQRDCMNTQKSGTHTLRRHGSTLPPPLEKFISPPEENRHVKAVLGTPASSNRTPEPFSLSVQLMEERIRELQRRDASSAEEVDLEDLKSDHQRAIQMVHQWKKTYEDLQRFCVEELLGSSHGGGGDRRC